MLDYFNLTYIQGSQRHWLILPGMLGSADDLRPVCPNNDSFILIDYALDKDSNIDDFFNQLTVQLKALLPKNSILYGLGYSMGGRILQYLMVREPMLIQRGIFISSAVGIMSPKDRYLKYKFESLASNKLATLSSADFLEWWYSLPIYNTLPHHTRFKDLVEKKVAEFNQDQIELRLLKFSALCFPYRLACINSPCLYVVGEKDHRYVQMIQHWGPEQFPKLSTVVIPAASHLCFWEAPTEIIAHISQWLLHNTK
ncbi:MAG: alpha/beta fold hydrolase [Candidatus Margulisiibacteriota bacterium]